jgi:hypothetical protein
MLITLAPLARTFLHLQFNQAFLEALVFLISFPTPPTPFLLFTLYSLWTLSLLLVVVSMLY